jgi:hypothetical protein
MVMAALVTAVDAFDFAAYADVGAVARVER